jgi:N-acetylglucosaminyldiphosphoundecaprenol N-acetyl-beta-D-mannosaminyltransferase
MLVEETGREVVKRTSILGVPVDAGTWDEVKDALGEHLERGQGCLHVATLNPEYVITARKDPAFAAAIDGAGLVTVDGVGVSLGLRLLEPGLDSGRVTGVLLSWYLAELSARMEEGLFLLGAGPGVAQDAGRNLVEAHPGAWIVGAWGDGSPRRADDARTIARIRESRASMLLVAYGAPAQVHWIHRNLPELESADVRIVIGIGGALDYISGNVPWAPPLVRRLGLEWVYRLLREPWRWRRQLVLPLFAVLVVKDALAALARRKVPAGVT